jgi:acetylornithine/succinyldiaminopimelate/putrescine aminotransferase
MIDGRWPTYALRNLVLDGAVPSEDAARGAIRVRDTEGREYVDLVNGIGCLPLGHGHPRWVEAVAQQLGRLTASSGTYWTRPQQELAAEIARRSLVPDGRVFFTNSGTEATEAALKLALKATRRDTLLVFERAFHGRTLGALSLTANADYRQPYLSCLDEPEGRFARMNVVRVGFGDLEATAAMLDRFRDRVAAVFVEPIQGEAGIYPATREFLIGLRELCNRHGALLGADEIQSGSGRTGRFTAWSTMVGDDPELMPDILWFAKALGGGWPIGACLTRAELAAHMSKGSHGSTFGGSPAACAAALATLRIMDEEHLFESAGAQFDTLRELARQRPHPRIAELRGVGSMMGVEIAGGDSAATPIGDILQRRGILVTVCVGKTVRFLPAYRVGEPELRHVWTQLCESLDEAGQAAPR